MVEWGSLGAVLLKKSRRIDSLATFKSYFKLDPVLVEIVWKRLSARFDCHKENLLKTLFFLKSHDPDHSKIALQLNTKYDSLKRVVLLTLSQIKAVSPEVCGLFYE